MLEEIPASAHSWISDSLLCLRDLSRPSAPAGFVGFPLAFVDSQACGDVQLFAPDPVTQADCDNVLTCTLPEVGDRILG